MIHTEIKVCERSHLLMEQSLYLEKPKSQLEEFFKNMINPQDPKINQEDKIRNDIAWEVDTFLGETPLPLETDVLNWWKDNKTRFPKMSLTAQASLSIVATQVSCERLHSDAGNIVTDTRSRLLCEHVEEICFLHSNYDIENNCLKKK